MQRLKKEEREPLPKILQDIFAQACPLLMAPAMGFSLLIIEHYTLGITYHREDQRRRKIQTYK